MKKIFVSGGTGYVGSAVINLLKTKNCQVLFSWHQNSTKAKELTTKTGFDSISLDLSGDLSLLKEKLRLFQPDSFIHCAATCEDITAPEIDQPTWQKVQSVNCHSAFEISQFLFENMRQKNNGDIVLVNGLANSQSYKLPIHFAASQGAQNAMAMAMAKEMGQWNIKVNSISLGLLENGLSKKFPAKMHQDFLTFSALQRKGNAEEAAQVICKFALNNTYVNGKNICVNGGI